MVGELTPNEFELIMSSGHSVPTPRASSSPHFLKTVVEMKASGPSHVQKLWMEVSKDMLPVTYFCSNKVFSLCPSNVMETIRHLQR